MFDEDDNYPNMYEQQMHSLGLARSESWKWSTATPADTCRVCGDAPNSVLHQLGECPYVHPDDGPVTT